MTLIEKLKADPHKIFLIDGFGALLSAFLLGIVLLKFEPFFGMPQKALYILAIIPIFFAAYDVASYFIKSKEWKRYLKSIAVANLAYCIVSLGFVINHASDLTILGLIYFAAEIAIILILTRFEYKLLA